MSKSRGFTLVELAAAMFALALLVTMVAAAADAAKSQGRQMTCRSNLFSLSKSMHAYCADNNDYWPPYMMSMKNGQPYVASTFTCMERTMWAAKVGDLSPPTLRQRYRGVGIMYGAGYVQDARNFYCPAQTFSWFLYESYTINDATGETVPWGTWDNWSNNVRMGFFFNAWGRRYDDPLQWDMAFRTLSSMENDKAMAIDQCIFPWASEVHLSKGGERVSFNVLHPDGRADIYSSTTVIGVLNNNWASVLKNWEQSGPDNDWAEIYTRLQAGQ
jgi:prepilin-type N-terminal cleavage/methylation domain-containing protein